jgi:hypothetical protein
LLVFAREERGTEEREGDFPSSGKRDGIRKLNIWKVTYLHTAENPKEGRKEGRKEGLLNADLRCV